MNNNINNTNDIYKEWEENRTKVNYPRTITINLTDSDCEDLSEKAAQAGMTTSELIQSFIRDLVCSHYSNGSDERDCAYDWFDRCDFHYDGTLLQHLANSYVDIDDFLFSWRAIQDIVENPVEAAENYGCNIEDLDIIKHEYENDINDYLEGWNPYGTPDMSKEVALIEKWKLDKTKLRYHS